MPVNEARDTISTASIRIDLHQLDKKVVKTLRFDLEECPR